MIGLPLSSLRLRRAWRFTAKWFCGSGFASAMAVMLFSGSVSTVTADSVIAVLPAALPPESSSGDAPTAAISELPKAGRIIAIGSGTTGAGNASRA
jgi:hypothetical protein